MQNKYRNTSTIVSRNFKINNCNLFSVAQAHAHTHTKLDFILRIF